jgi:hypothetical protein
MKCVICGQPIEEGRKQGQPPQLAKYCLKCRAERRRRSRVKYAWLPEHAAYLKAHYFGGLNRRFQVLTRMVRMTGLPRWYIKRQAARLGLTMKVDRRSWTGGVGSSREPGGPRVISNNRKTIAPSGKRRRQQVEAIGHLPTRSRRLHDAGA